MKFAKNKMGRQKTMKLGRILQRAASMAVLWIAAGVGSFAQSTNADLSGIIVDSSGARLPKARITLQNDKSKDLRTAVTNRDGVYQFVSVPTGTYTMTVKGVGFSTYQETDIELHPGDQRALPDIPLRAGDEATITVSAAASDIIESGELSALISKDDIAHLAVEGRDVTELVKILPGFALNTGGTTGLSNVAPNSVGVSLSGQADNYAANGSPEGGVGIISDGSNVQDPGSAGATTQTINMDMVEEVKVQTSNFGAESAKGPIVVNAVGKSGGSVYHGSLYIIGNASPMNSQDWLTNYFNLTKPQDRYIYPGGNIGGPVRIPGTNFNHAKKLTFFAGGEDYIQKNVFAGGTAANALRLTTVPSDRMRAGDWSTDSLAQWLGVGDSALLAGCDTTNTAAVLGLSNFQTVCAQPVGVDAKGAQITNGIIQNYDPGGAAYLNIFPHANRVPQPVPNGNITDGYNRTDLYLFDNNLWQARGRLDYAFSDTTKIYAIYNTEQGQGYGPSAIYYTGGDVLRNPSLNVGEVHSKSASVDFTKVLTPSMTNEVVVSGAYYYNPYHAQNESVQTATALGYPYAGLVNTGSVQIPQLGYSSGTTVPQYSGPDFSFGPIYSRKQSLDVGDNYTWVIKSHTLKLGVYGERIANNQVNSEPTQGAISEYSENGVGFPIIAPTVPGQPQTVVRMAPGNEEAQLFLGIASYYSQYLSQPVLDMHYNVLDGFASDAWKATRNLTLTYGVRFEHLGPWIDSRGTGLAIWQPQNYGTVLPSQTVTLNTLPGISWHAQNSSIPLSGDLGRAVFVSPRAGFSYDLSGNGRTVVGGGWGAYRSHDSWNDFEGALATAKGSYGLTVSNVTLHCIDAIGRGLANATTTVVGGPYADCTQTASSGQNVQYGNVTTTAIAANDTQQPVSYTYSLSVTQQMLWKSQFKIGYAGSENAHILVRGGLQSINTIPFGAEFGPDPNPASAQYGQIQAPDSIAQTSDYRKYPFYYGLNILRHDMHTNYNSLQTSWERRTGHFLYMFNYTWSKAEGDLAAVGRTNSVPDLTNKANDRGILNFDRTHIFNATYTFILGNIWHRNAIVGGFVNGWEVSGITNVQSGPNLQSATASNFSLQGTNVNSQTFTQSPIPGVPNITTDSQTWLGTPDILLQPATICDPSTNLKSMQYINASCLVLPKLGTNGPYRLPYLRGPGFFNTDLSVQKSWAVGNKKMFIVRAAGFNFINHPLTSLVAAGTATPLELVLSDDPSTASSTGFGRAIYKQGRRVIEITLRYNF
jgi:hypothetical protein